MRVSRFVCAGREGGVSRSSPLLYPPPRTHAHAHKENSGSAAFVRARVAVVLYSMRLWSRLQYVDAQFWGRKHLPLQSYGTILGHWLSKVSSGVFSPR